MTQGDEKAKPEMTDHGCMFCGEAGRGLVEQDQHYCYPCRLDEIYEVLNSRVERERARNSERERVLVGLLERARKMVIPDVFYSYEYIAQWLSDLEKLCPRK